VKGGAASLGGSVVTGSPDIRKGGESDEAGLVCGVDPSLNFAYASAQETCESTGREQIWQAAGRCRQGQFFEKNANAAPVKAKRSTGTASRLPAPLREASCKSGERGSVGLRRSDTLSCCHAYLRPIVAMLHYIVTKLSNGGHRRRYFRAPEQTD